ncbi:carboxymuconolactone decarboxylase family protein [Pseudonocardia sp. C8]|uniref:Carboxymuconolactone decarboxylase family protein n=1 Tax=Saccharopolyspora cebuensis TaxID=418759 RepID=A0ABV4CR06_9PSEU|nr:carboxymuconolactone decarboxylase family protein [Pseudonocardia sp. C8]MBC3193976.1 carboxymuconolactone decarboxylase family protein [Pseudonocardia sp. C8]
MVEFRIHDEHTAPHDVAPSLEHAKQSFGFVPNLYGVFAESPQAFNAYQALSDQFQNTSLSTQAKHVVWLAASRQNSCHYCMAVHSAMAQQAGVNTDTIDALRNDKPIPDESLEAVRRFTQAVVAHQGFVPEDETQAFLAAGYSQRQILDIVLGVAMKTLSNYTNHFANTPVDDAFQPHTWNA